MAAEDGGGCLSVFGSVADSARPMSTDLKFAQIIP